MDESYEKYSSVAPGTRGRSGSAFTNLFHSGPGNKKMPGLLTSFKMACILSFPVFTTLPCLASQSGLVTSFLVILALGACSYFACKLILAVATLKDKSILDTVSRLFGPRYKMLFLLAGGLHFILVGSIYLREST